MMGQQLVIQDLTKTYKRGKRKANDSISTSFKAGEITALIGHNGAGKTTLLNQIIAITKPNSGDIIYKNQSFVENPKSARNFVSIMPQLDAPLSGVTISQAIKAILRIRGVSRSATNAVVDNIVQELNIEQWRDTLGDKLSGGLRRLTSFAMTVVAPSNIILLDEPTNDVDPIRRQLIWRYVRKLSGLGHIILIVTHNLLEVERYADRYVLFDQGRLIKDERLRENKDSRFTNTLVIHSANSEGFGNDDFPSVVNKKELEKGKLMLTVSLDQMAATCTWLLVMISQKKISYYKLSPTSLEDAYGGMVDE